MSKTLQELFFTKASEKGAAAAQDKRMEAKTPMLYSLLTCTSLGGGKTRKPCTLTIFAGDGVWKASLKERDHNMVLWAACDSLEGIPEALEAQLALEVIPWRQQTFGAGKRS